MEQFPCCVTEPEEWFAVGVDEVALVFGDAELGGGGGEGDGEEEGEDKVITDHGI